MWPLETDPPRGGWGPRGHRAEHHTMLNDSSSARAMSSGRAVAGLGKEKWLGAWSSLWCVDRTGGIARDAGRRPADMGTEHLLSGNNRWLVPALPGMLEGAWRTWERGIYCQMTMDSKCHAEWLTGMASGHG
jgi:hypothetical protein